MPARAKVVAFDVIGTTFSLEPLRNDLVQLGFPAHMLELWFAQTLRDAFALAATGSFAPFRSVFEGTLDGLAASRFVRVTAEQKQQLMSRFGALPPHPDAAEAFLLLNGAGVRVFALSNGAAATSDSLLQKANLKPLVERVISVEDISVFKPRSEIYRHAAEVGGVAPSDMALVASHAWDVHGAKNAGLLAAFVARGHRFPSTMKAPDFIGESLSDVARQLIL
jgi:2-haloacid dehalogenase